MKNSVIFDMDGTLWDSVDNIAKSWNMVCRKYPDAKETVITRENLLALMGQTMDKFETALMPSTMSGERAHELVEECMQFENEYLRRHGGRLLGDVASVFAALKEKGVGIYIVSNCQSGYIEAFLTHYHLEHLVDDIECYGNTNRGKAENLKLLLARNEMESCVYLGDTQGDCDACREAGVPFVWASYGFGTVAGDTAQICALEQIVDVM